MLKFVDTLLNRITMYRLALYYLIFLLLVAIIFSFGGVLPYNPYMLLFTTAFELAVCLVVNALFSKTFGVPANAESAYISALILALIITPMRSNADLWFLGWAGVWAMASKYILAINRKHLFNPAAFAVALTYLTINQSASWWVGNAPMLPFVLAGGLLMVRKIRRFGMVGAFLLSALAVTIVLSLVGRESPVSALQGTVLYSPLLFFAFIILTEPLTTPPARRMQLIYGAGVGVLLAPQFHIGAFYPTPELAILLGNVFSFIVSPKTNLTLRLEARRQLAPDIYDFIFAPARKFAFAPGQYMEWTLGHRSADNRGNRRYFTLASSPTEDRVRLGVKFYQHSSSFKSALLALETGAEISAAQLGGDFVLPDDPTQRCVFIAGGIGITPFRSMIKYLLDSGQRRPITLFYANRRIGDIVYKDVLDQAEQRLGIKTIYVVTDTLRPPPGWRGRVGHISPQMIAEEVPDYRNCTFYISGPPNMVDACKELLLHMQVAGSRIKTDLFSGLA